MVEFLNTEEVSARLVAIISNAGEFLYLISPYLSVNDRLKQRIEAKASSEVSVHIIYRHQEQRSDVSAWLESLPSTKTSFCENLHAKCYLNESEALLTSMNLYEFSQVNNYEMGVLISRREEPELYRKIFNEVEHIREGSTTVHEPLVEAPPTVDALPTGFCIRSRHTIPANPVKPYCNRCFRSWNQYKNNDYEEKHCHLCGDEHKTSMSKPACLSCYRKYRNVLEFAVS